MDREASSFPPCTQVSSVEPPPMSMSTTVSSGKGTAWATAWKMSRASSSPEITRMPRPRAAAWRTNSWALLASRRAAVPQASTVSQPWNWMAPTMRPSASRPARKASSEMAPVRSCPRARRTITFSRSRIRSSPIPVASTTTMWMELEPTSTAATFMGPRRNPEGPALGREWAASYPDSEIQHPRRMGGRGAS